TGCAPLPIAARKSTDLPLPAVPIPHGHRPPLFLRGDPALRVFMTSSSSLQQLRFNNQPYTPAPLHCPNNGQSLPLSTWVGDEQEHFFEPETPLKLQKR